MAGKIKVLEVNVDDQGNGGVYSLIKSVIENKPENLQIDIAALEPFEKKENIRYLRSLGTRIFFTGYKGNKIKKQLYIYKHMCTLLKKERYDVVHIHSDVANKLLVSGLAAKACGVPNIILHSHATGTDGKNRKIKKVVHDLCRNYLQYVGTDYAACSYAAAKWMFPEIARSDIKLVKNGIDIKKYAYAPKIREIIRHELGLEEDDYLIGHVGRFMYQKNHEYVIEVYDSFLREWNNKKCAGVPKLLLAGEGELKGNIMKMVKDKGFSENVIFVGLSNRVNELMQGMDAFILPSFFEGLPIVGIEAQASGLPVIFSDKITKEARLTKKVAFLPIEYDKTDLWVKKLFEYKEGYQRKNTSAMLEKKSYSINSTVNYLISLYKRG